ncbi:phosphatase PAP2 family protein [Paracoccus sp. Z330]|uniref:Phosphatase PAP2 family protein n=1 Tax=Paracoccus onchidii TaxID=3017813 RepID=A0ABT4ZFN4_9RHOB|nr:phosphatase PAP2 family protein [Paracoccus onchidii]MDB6178143.1 phosphatase PAP2 family protein [Paracoccus onchidii]
MTMALMRARDAIAGAELISPDAGTASSLDMAARLERLDGDHRAAVMAGELLEDISFSFTDYAPAENTSQTVTVLRRTTDGDALNASYVSLAQITRPGLAEFSEATQMVANYAELRADRSAEIQVQTQHLVPFFASIMPIEASRSPAIREALFTALDVATFVVMRVKLALGCPRPTQFSNRIQPMITCPSHATLPSGHATQAFTLATVLSLLENPAATVAPDSQLYRLACRIAINRTVAGVHFPADSAAGAVLGIQLGRYLAARAGAQINGSGKVGNASFDGTQFTNGGQARDFHYAILNEMTNGTDPSADFTGAATAVRPAPMWGSLVMRAMNEWGQRWS